MKRVAVVIDGSADDRGLLEEAAACVTGTTADMLVLGIVTESAYENDQEVIEAIESAENADFSSETPEEYAQRATQSLVGDVLTDADFEYTIEGYVTDDDDHAETILDATEAHNCDHVFLHGKRRSPAGKAIFGDTAQQVILTFDGYVTVSVSE